MQEIYPHKIRDKIRNISHAGRLSRFDTEGVEVSFICGTITRFFLKLDAERKAISDISFQSNGCGFVLAACDFFAENTKGKHLTELEGLEKLKMQLEEELGEFPPNRRHCLTMSFDALKSAFAELRRKQIQEFSGEKALICTCFGVSEETIESVVREMAAETIEQVIEACRAGSGCGSCRPLIQEIIDQSKLPY